MIIYGKQTVLHFIERHPKKIKRLIFSKEIDKKLFSRLSKLNIAIERRDEKGAQGLAKGGNHQGFLAEINDLQFASLSEIRNKEFILLLSSLNDMGNIGALLRTALALGVEAVIIGGIKDIKTETLARSSSGALFDIPIVHQHNLLDAMNELKQSDFKFYGATLDGNDIKDLSTSGKRALVLGNEGEGLTKKITSHLDYKVTIPMANEFNSLNVNAAGAILIQRMR